MTRMEEGTSGAGLWKHNLFLLQEKAPRPRVVPCDREVESRPSFYGREFHGSISRAQAEQVPFHLPLIPFLSAAASISGQWRVPGACLPAFPERVHPVHHVRRARAQLQALPRRRRVAFRGRQTLRDDRTTRRGRTHLHVCGQTRRRLRQEVPLIFIHSFMYSI